MKNIKQKNILWQCLKQLSTLNTSIVLLLIIAIISILGTIIEQDQTISYYQTNYPINNNIFLTLNWYTIISLGLNQIYTTWWFLLLLVLFFCSLIICTFSRQLPGLRNARNWKFKQKINKSKNQPTFDIYSTKGLSRMIYCLNSKNYYTFHKKNSIYGYKGLMGRIAPIFVHISIILTLTGSLIGLFTGFMAQQIIPKGEIFHIQNTIKSGFCSYLPNHIVGKINNFTIDYNENNSIKQFYSDISLFKNTGQFLKRKKIYVNSPLRFQGLVFYQTDWKINGLRIQINSNNILQEKLTNIKIGNTNIWLYRLPVTDSEYISFIITGIKDKILVYNSFGKLIHAVNINEILEINHKTIMIKEIMVSTGLQIKTDPGLYIVYTGFLVLMISIAVSYLSYSQVWVYNSNQIIHLTGKTNRAKLNFEEDLIYIKKTY